MHVTSSLLPKTNNTMKNIKIIQPLAILVVSIFPLFFSSCVSHKKYNMLDTSYKKLQENEKSCDDKLKTAQSSLADLTRQKNDLQAQVDYLKKNSTQVLSTLQDM